MRVSSPFAACRDRSTTRVGRKRYKKPYWMGLMPSITTSKFFYTYVLESRKDGKKYIGFTIDLRNRLIEHQAGKVFSTKGRRPLELIYYEACRSETDARRREGYLKTTGAVDSWSKG